MMCLTALTPMPLASQSEPDTVLVHAVYAGKPLLKLMKGLASVAKGAFVPDYAEAIQKQAWERSCCLSETPDLPMAMAYAYQVQGRSQRTAILAIFLLSTQSHVFDVRIQVADDGLMKAIRAHLAELGIDSLTPIDRTRLTFGEGGVAGSPARLVLRTVRRFSCSGYHLDHDMQRAGFDTLLLNLHGVAAPHEACPGPAGPATMSRELPTEPARKILLVSYGGRSDRLILEVSDSATTVKALDSSLVQADERPRWRYPPNGFVLRCGDLEQARTLCSDAQAWVAQQPGISRISFSQGAKNPPSPKPAIAPDAGIGFYSYDQVVYFERLRPCFGAIDKAIREAVGVFLTLEDWRGTRITANSQRASHERHIEVPSRMSNLPACPTPSWGPR
ncbi:MAG TPA: hypothetical protein VIG04_11410 [Gemmatimonadales bacterium]